MTADIDTDGAPRLRRSIGTTQLALYALGSMVGSGIYGLIGKAAGQAGSAVWLSFLVALFAALLTSLSYASLGSRYPRAGGAAYMTDRAFGIPVLSFTVGLALIASGLTSIATQSKIFAEILVDLTGISIASPAVVAVGFLLIMTGVVFRGIRESIWVNVGCTIMEVSGLLLVIMSGMSYWGTVDYFQTPAEHGDATLAVVVLQASVLAFFAFIGFEDAINVAEECKNPEVTIPLGLVIATLAAAVLYIGVAITAVSVVPWQELAEAPSPLTEVMKRSAPSIPPWLMSFIALFSVANTALVNYVTASRLIYGMANQRLLPERFARVHRTRRTPYVAILALLVAMLLLLVIGNIADLAAATVLLLLVVFIAVNASLIVLKRKPGEVPGRFEIPIILPVIGLLICGTLLAVRIASSNWKAPALAMAILLASVVAYVVLRASRKELR
ncbi:amino acid transporter [Hyphomicrobium methylovorum]|uniref:APC family permease n=1 Tax=Hyphomicrobium methylovorum TaxID=84 RepID=UPI0015E763E5|nr:amino acid permease [Hyphomicrobium methylovorum]MBA2127074.1 amino acid transporter [Hyphomicrobium methylovorum]